MNAPLTKAALANAGVKFQAVRQETAAGHIEVAGYSLRGTDDRKALLTWVMTHLPASWHDATAAARLPQVITEMVPQLAAPSAAADKPGYQKILKAAHAAIFGA